MAQSIREMLISLDADHVNDRFFASLIITMSSLLDEDVTVLQTYRGKDLGKELCAFKTCTLKIKPDSYTHMRSHMRQLRYKDKLTRPLCALLHYSRKDLPEEIAPPAVVEGVVLDALEFSKLLANKGVSTCHHLKVLRTMTEVGMKFTTNLDEINIDLHQVVANQTTKRCGDNKILGPDTFPVHTNIRSQLAHMAPPSPQPGKSADSSTQEPADLGESDFDTDSTLSDIVMESESDDISSMLSEDAIRMLAEGDKKLSHPQQIKYLKKKLGLDVCIPVDDRLMVLYRTHLLKLQRMRTVQADLSIIGHYLAFVLRASIEPEDDSWDKTYPGDMGALELGDIFKYQYLGPYCDVMYGIGIAGVTMRFIVESVERWAAFMMQLARDRKIQHEYADSMETLKKHVAYVSKKRITLTKNQNASKRFAQPEDIMNCVVSRSRARILQWVSEQRQNLCARIEDNTLAQAGIKEYSCYTVACIAIIVLKNFQRVQMAETTRLVEWQKRQSGVDGVVVYVRDHNTKHTNQCASFCLGHDEAKFVSQYVDFVRPYLVKIGKAYYCKGAKKYTEDVAKPTGTQIPIEKHHTMLFLNTNGFKITNAGQQFRRTQVQSIGICANETIGCREVRLWISSIINASEQSIKMKAMIHEYMGKEHYVMQPHERRMNFMNDLNIMKILAPDLSTGIIQPTRTPVVPKVLPQRCGIAQAAKEAQPQPAEEALPQDVPETVAETTEVPEPTLNQRRARNSS